MRKLKCYRGNYDGRREGLVFAHNKKEAAKLANATLYGFNEYWHEWEPTTTLNLKPLTLYTKKFSVRDDDSWFEGRCEIKIT
jgi:hypothetical protein